MSDEQISVPTPTRHFTFSIGTLLSLTFWIAFIFTISKLLGGAPYGWLTAVPLVIGLPLFLSRPKNLIGGVTGFFFFAYLGAMFIIGFDTFEPRFLLAQITIGAYGFTCGGAIYAYFHDQRMQGSLIGTLVMVAFAIVLLVG